MQNIWHTSSRSSVECRTIDEAISSLSELSSLTGLWMDQVQEKMGRESATQGPQGAISTKSRLIESLLPVKISLQEVNPELQNHLKLAVTLALVTENFYSQMRSRNDMPTVLEFARYVFVPTTLEFLKQLTDTGFCVLHLATLVL